MARAQIVTEAELRAQLRQPELGAEVAVPSGATLTPSAQDFVATWQLRLVEPGPAAAGAEGQRHDWVRPISFPVVTTGDRPRCATCGTTVEHKPEHLTQLDPYQYAPKTEPRIRFRGRLDSLHAGFLLVGGTARRAGDEATADRLATLAAYCRELMSAEYHLRPAAPLSLDGLGEAALRRATHDPKASLGVDHLLPADTDPPLILELNWLRCQVREVELAALGVFPPGHCEAGDTIIAGLNRLSSAVYYVTLRVAAAGREAT